MGAHRADPPVFQHHHPVGPLQGGNAVGDDQRGPGMPEAVDAADQIALGLVVHRGQHVVQDQQVAGLEDGAGQGDALLLPAGKGDPLFAHLGRQPLGKLCQVGLQGRRFHRLGDQSFQGIPGAAATVTATVTATVFGAISGAISGAVFCAVFCGEADVFPHGVGEEERLLGHRHQVPPQGLLAQLRHIDAVEEDLVRGRVEVAVEQIDQGGLARSDGSEQPHDLSGPHLERNPVQHRMTGIVRVGVAEIGYPQPLGKLLGQPRLGRRGNRGQGGMGVEDPLQAGQGGDPPLHHEHHEGQAHQGRHQHGEVEQICHEAAHGHLPAHHQRAPHQHQHHLERVGNVGQDRHEKGPHPGHADRAVPHGAAQSGESFSRPTKAPVGFEHVDAAVGLHGEFGKVLQGLHLHQLFPPQSPHRQLQQYERHRDGNGAIQCQPGRDLVHVIGRQREGADGRDGSHDPEAHHHAYPVDIVVDP